MEAASLSASASPAAAPPRRRARARRATEAAARPPSARSAGSSAADSPAHAPSAHAPSPHAPSPHAPSPYAPSRRVLVLGCGALVNELQAVVRGLPAQPPVGNGSAAEIGGHAGAASREAGGGSPGGIDIECLPAKLHNRPALIAGEVRARLDRLAQQGRTYERILLGYGDCGSAGALDDLCRDFEQAHAAGNGPSMTRVPGAHCYEFFAGADHFAEISDAEPATFYLTDYLARHFDLLVWRGLGIADHPELADMYFGNYRRVVLLTQTPDDDERVRVEACARAGAERLGLPLVVVPTGYGELADAVTSVSLDTTNRQAAP